MQNIQRNYIYKALKIVANYLSPLAKNYYKTKDTSSFPDLLKSAPCDDNYGDFPYHVKNLFKYTHSTEYWWCSLQNLHQERMKAILEKFSFQNSVNQPYKGMSFFLKMNGS